MKKIKELAQNGEFSQNLMADKDFVTKAKEIFKSENIEMDDQKLAQLINEIESKLAKSDILNDKALEAVSGGITNKTKRAIINRVSSIAGAFVGGAVGGAVGDFAGGKMGSQSVPAMRAIRGESSLSPEELRGSGIGGQAVGRISLGLAGGLVGGEYGGKLGNLICKKMGINED